MIILPLLSQLFIVINIKVKKLDAVKKDILVKWTVLSFSVYQYTNFLKNNQLLYLFKHSLKQKDLKTDFYFEVRCEYMQL